ncbi:MAG: DNA-binding response regulator [Flavobacteriales bacterium]|nr:DNA-binding response regulator [Flavobacteriales bacterium]MBO72399.1 DNA-binding response regulator [Flavobacteriales bacterium]
MSLKQMKCVLIDDEPMDLMALSELMSTYDEIEIVGKFHNPIEAKDFVNKSKVDVIVLDVEMPELNGIDFIKSIKNVEHIILISSNKTYAAESYDYNVTDYIVKPISKKRLGLAIEKVKLVDDSIKTSSNRDFAFVKDGTKIIRIDFKEILFIEALADYVQINTEHGRYTVLATMKSMQANLPEDDFFRIHRSYIVRKDKIRVIEDNMILMETKNIPISRSSKQEFFNTFNFL